MSIIFDSWLYRSAREFEEKLEGTFNQLGIKFVSENESRAKQLAEGCAAPLTPDLLFQPPISINSNQVRSLETYRVVQNLRMRLNEDN